jgi:hypothetical protein
MNAEMLGQHVIIAAVRQKSHLSSCPVFFRPAPYGNAVVP